MKTLKSLAFFRLYFTSIEIALNTQMLRKHIYKGKTCYQSAFLLLYTYLIIGSKLTVEKLTKNFMKPFSLRGKRPQVVAILIRLRIYFTYIYQALAGHANRLSCKGAGRLPKNHRTQSSDFLPTNACLSSAFYAAGSQFSSGQHRRGPTKNRCRLDENSRKGRIWSGVGRELVSLFLAVKGTIDSRLSYRECTERVPKRYWKGTKELLKRYQIATKQVRTFGSFLVNLRYKVGRIMEIPVKMRNTDLVIEAYGCCLKSEDLQALCGARICKNGCFVAREKISTQKALKCFSVVANYERAYRIVLTCITLLLVFQSSNFSFKALKSIRALMVLALMVSMFSLSAQTPRKDSGADGLSSSLVALKPGDRIPDAVWEQSLELNYFNGKKKTIKFADLKGKLILLDFWATWCPSCIEGFPHLEDVKTVNKDEIVVLLVNSAQTKDTQKRVRDLKKKYKTVYGFQTSLPYLFGDTIFQQLFPHNAIPHVVWIDKNGMLVANTYPDAVTKENVNAVLHNESVHLHQKEWRSKDEPALISGEMMNNGFYAGSIFRTYLEGLDASYGNYSFDGKRTRFQIINLSFSKLLSIAFQRELKGIPWRSWRFDAVKAPDSKQKLLASNRYDNRFCYEMVYMDSLSKVGAKKWFTEDFKRFFGIELSVENKPTDVLQIAFNSAFEKIRSKGGVPEVFLGDSRTEMKFRNIPLELLVDNLSLYFNKPLVIGKSNRLLVDMTIPKEFNNWEQDVRKEFLRTMGLELNAARETIACATFLLVNR